METGSMFDQAQAQLGTVIADASGFLVTGLIAAFAVPVAFKVYGLLKRVLTKA